MESTSKENSEVQYVRIHGDTGGLQYIYSLWYRQTWCMSYCAIWLVPLQVGYHFISY